MGNELNLLVSDTELLLEVESTASLHCMVVCTGKEILALSQAPGNLGWTFFVTCAFIITIILNPHLNNKPSKLCGDLNKSISTFSKSVVSTATHVKDCKVVLEDISSSRDAVKLKMLNTS